jgi:hypothetical protein
MKAVCGLAAGALLLAACSSESATDSSAAPIVLAPEVAAHLDRYLNEINSGRKGAFAVSRTGDAAFYSICDHGGCHGQFHFSSEAIEGCEKQGRGRCVVLASNSVIKRPYKTGTSLEALLSQAQAISAPDYVSGDRIRQELAGNSIVETDFEGKIWAEYFDPNGTLRGRTNDGALFNGVWKIEDNTLCVDYRSIAQDWCGQFVEASDGSIDYYKDGKFRNNYSRSVLKKGNPQNL